MSNLLKAFHLKDDFFGKYEKLVVEQVIPYQEAALRDEIPEAEKSHAIENFRQAAKMLAEGKCDEEFYGMVFQDSDLAKWLEAAAITLLAYPAFIIAAASAVDSTKVEHAPYSPKYGTSYFIRP